MIVQPDGNIVVAGSVYNATRDFALIRFTATGAVDKTFSGDGKVTIDFGLDELLNAVALQADGSYLLAGQSFNDWEKDFAVARVLP